jgi:hypothetical protein
MRKARPGACAVAEATPDLRRNSPAAERNRESILEQLRRWLPAHGDMLEIAAGTGQHAVHFAAALPAWQWQPTDPDPAALASIAAWREAAALPNLRAPLELDVLAPQWPLAARFDALFCANMLHIAPWPTCGALMRGAARHLVDGGQLILYGPYRVEGVETAPSNLAFDADLHGRNPAWGLRRLQDVQAEAAAVGLELRDRHPMPANNLMLRMVAKGS